MSSYDFSEVRATCILTVLFKGLFSIIGGRGGFTPRGGRGFSPGGRGGRGVYNLYNLNSVFQFYFLFDISKELLFGSIFTHKNPKQVF